MKLHFAEEIYEPLDRENMKQWEKRGYLVDVDVALLQHEEREAATDTLDGGQRIRDLSAAVHVGVAHTQNVLEILGHEIERHGGKNFRLSNPKSDCRPVLSNPMVG